MKNLAFLFLIFLLQAAFLTTEAQVNNYLKNKAKQAAGMAGRKADREVTKEMNKKVDNEVEKVFDKLFNNEDSLSSSSEGESEDYQPGNSQRSSSSQSDKSDARAKAMLKSMGINTAPANVKATYSYTGFLLMNVQSWNDNGDTDGDMEYFTYMSKDNSGFAMQFQQPGKGTSTMIFDYAGEQMIILSDENGEKNGIVTDYAGLSDTIQAAIEESDEDTQENMEDYTIYNENLKKTGKTKKIAGYSCDEYIYEDEESIGNIWMTKELPAEMWSKMITANVFAASSMGYYGGFVMESDQREKNTQNRVYMIVKEVNKDKSTSISTAGYQLMSFGINPQ